EPVVRATANPVTAPITIMPSTPRLSTPERSTTSSPIAAMSKGVAAVAIVMSICSSTLGRLPGLRFGSFRGRRACDPNPVVDECVAGEHEEEQHALKCPHRLVGDADRNLCGFASQIGQGQDDAGSHDAKRVQASKEGNDDCGKAIADRNLLVEVLD